MKINLIITFLFITINSFSQERQNPVISPFGGIYNIPEASVKADPNLEYKIVIDVVTANENPAEFNWSLNNVARLLNLHVVSGADPEKISVVLAIHGGATYAVVSNTLYKEKYGVENPNIDLLTALKNAGVKITVCGQSLISREIDMAEVNENVEIATSMLTTVTTYQLNGYALLRF